MELQNVINAFTFLATPFNPIGKSPRGFSLKLCKDIEDLGVFDPNDLTEEATFSYNDGKQALEAIGLYNSTISLKGNVISFYPNWEQLDLNLYVKFLVNNLRDFFKVQLFDVSAVYGHVYEDSHGEDFMEKTLYQSKINEFYPLLSLFGIQSLKHVVDTDSVHCDECIKISLIPTFSGVSNYKFNPITDMTEFTFQYGEYTLGKSRDPQFGRLCWFALIPDQDTLWRCDYDSILHAVDEL